MRVSASGVEVCERVDGHDRERPRSVRGHGAGDRAAPEPWLSVLGEPLVELSQSRVGRELSRARGPGARPGVRLAGGALLERERVGAGRGAKSSQSARDDVARGAAQTRVAGFRIARGPSRSSASGGGTLIATGDDQASAQIAGGSTGTEAESIPRRR